MRRFLSILLAPCAVILASPAPACGTSDCGDTVTGGTAMEDAASRTELRILVKFEAQMTAAAVESIHARLGVTVVDRLLDGTLYVVEVPYAETRDDIIAAYMATEGVVYAEPDQKVSIPEPPDGPESAPLIPLPKVE